MNDSLIAVIIGIVEGITEFLPISSTGHMIIVGSIIGFTGKRAASFEIFIQLGAILSVIFLYFKRFLALFDFSKKIGNSFSGIAGLSKLAIACFPACVLGLIFHKKIILFLFNPAIVATSFILGGAALLIIERNKNQKEITTLEEISYKQALLVGLAQCFALIPGVSRSGSMIVGGIYVGLSRILAAEFSFLVAVPIMILAATKDILDSLDSLNSADFNFFALGFFISFITALLAIKFFIGLLKKFSLQGFGLYRIALGMFIIHFMLK